MKVKYKFGIRQEVVFKYCFPGEYCLIEKFLFPLCFGKTFTYKKAIIKYWMKYCDLSVKQLIIEPLYEVQILQPVINPLYACMNERFLKWCLEINCSPLNPHAYDQFKSLEEGESWKGGLSEDEWEYHKTMSLTTFESNLCLKPE